MHPEESDLALVLKGPLSGEHLEGDNAERVEIGSRIDLLAQRLLGRHVLGRSIYEAPLRLECA